MTDDTKPIEVHPAKESTRRHLVCPDEMGVFQQAAPRRFLHEARTHAGVHRPVGCKSP